MIILLSVLAAAIALVFFLQHFFKIGPIMGLFMLGAVYLGLRMSGYAKPTYWWINVIAVIIILGTLMQAKKEGQL